MRKTTPHSAKTPIAAAILGACTLSLLFAAAPIYAAGGYGSDSQSSSSPSSPSASSGVPSDQGSMSPSSSFSALDVNSDGVISRDEARNSAILDLSDRFADADRDQSGSIDQSEFSAFEQQSMGTSPSSPSSGDLGSSPSGDVGNAAPGGGISGGTSGDMGSGSVDSQAALPNFSDLDANGDGVISRREARSVDLLQQQFDQADADQSGAIDQSEFSAFESTYGVPGANSTTPEATTPPSGGDMGGGTTGGGTSGGATPGGTSDGMGGSSGGM